MRRVRVSRRVVVGAAVVAGLAAAVWVLWPNPVPDWPPGAVIPVGEIATLYRDNEAPADRELRGRSVRVAVTPSSVSGAHPSIPLPHSGPPIAHATAGLWKVPTTADGDPMAHGDVQFRFPALAALGGLQPRQPAVIEGVCRGVERYNQGTRAELRFLVFEDCRVVADP
jgi:hypothetical protein